MLEFADESAELTGDDGKGGQNGFRRGRIGRGFLQSITLDVELLLELENAS